jgi:hypothetical protein
VPELGSLGSVRGAFSNERPYRELARFWQGGRGPGVILKIMWRRLSLSPSGSGRSRRCRGGHRQGDGGWDRPPAVLFPIISVALEMGLARPPIVDRSLTREPLWQVGQSRSRHPLPKRATTTSAGSGCPIFRYWPWSSAS